VEKNSHTMSSPKMKTMVWFYLYICQMNRKVFGRYKKKFLLEEQYPVWEAEKLFLWFLKEK
jgi:hypothetical protein